MLYAIDVSHHQRPEALHWEGMRKAGCDICTVRLAYGTKKDELAKEHVRRARDAGFAAIGAYLFVRTVQPIIDQFHAFWEAAEDVGYGIPQDILPALDMEDDTQKRPIGPGDAPFFEEMVRLFQHSKSGGAYAYITQRDWGRLGKPGFVLDMPLFVAHYAPASRAEPATPNGMPWDIWQHRVGPFEINGASGYVKENPALDQSRVRRLRFLSGEDMTFADPLDEELRRTPDESGTDYIRFARHEAWTRAYATELAQSSAADLLNEDRNRAFRAEQETLDETPEGENVS